MTIAQLAERLGALEKAVQQLEAKISQPPDQNRRWWVEDAGRFKNDPVFDEIVLLGREYRESLRPGTRKAKRARP